MTSKRVSGRGDVSACETDVANEKYGGSNCPCAQTVDEKVASTHAQRVNPGDYTAFHSAIIPSDTYFVVGDNLGNSFDSRIPEFGAVNADMIRGKPLFLYWSPNLRRLGCSLR